MRRRGEDVHAGDVLARAGDRLTLPRLSSLASAGVGEVAVHRRPRLHLLVTGSELLPLGAPPEPGKIHESNGADGRALLAERAGARVVDHGVIGDDSRPPAPRSSAGLEGDVLVVSGGVSVGPHDHVKPAFEACGVEEVFWRVRIKPGKPLWFGRRGDTLVFGLPGNPLSTIVGFACSSSRRCGGCAASATRARASNAAASASPARPVRRPHDVPDLALAPAPTACSRRRPTERQGSHMTGALGESDGFAIAPHGSGPLAAGSTVDAVRFV